MESRKIMEERRPISRANPLKKIYLMIKCLMVHFPRKTAFLTAWLIISVMCAGIFVIEKYGHDCTGEGCHICLEIQIAQCLIEAFGRLGISMVVIGVILRAGTLVKSALLSWIKNPIELKVRFNC